MSPTANFIRAWENNAARQPATLALITFTTPAATLRIASREVTLPNVPAGVGETLWECGLTADALTMRIAPLGPGPEPADCTIHLDDRSYPTIGFPVASMATYSWHGANVKLYLWEMSLSSTADLFQVFEGAVDSFEATNGELTLNLLQTRSWNKPCPPTTIDKSTYPNAPDGTSGSVLPIVYGDHVDFPLRAPFASGYGVNKRIHEDVGAQAGAVPYVLVDPGTGAANVKVVAAGHACLKLLDRNAGYSAALGSSDILNPLDTPGVTETLGASESYLTIDDDTLIAYYGVRPTDVRTASTALDGKRATDPFDETSCATLDQTGTPGHGSLRLAMPNLPNLGQIWGVALTMAYSGDPANATHTLRVYPKDTASGATGTPLDVGVVTSVVPAVSYGTYDRAFLSADWRFADSETHTVGPIDLIVDFSGGTTQKAKIYWVAAWVQYKPARSMVTPARVLPQSTAPHIDIGGRRVSRGGIQVGEDVAGYSIPETYSLTASFFGNMQGYGDDGSGTFTGAAGALIQRPPDIVRHLLATYGGQTSFETGAAAFGSFVLGRSLLAGSAGDFLMAGRIGQQSTVQQAIQAICGQALSCCLLDTQSGKWLFHVWKIGAGADYRRPFTRDDCADAFDCGATSDVALAQGVRVQYGYDHFKNRTMFEAFVTALGSGQGVNLPTIRDQGAITIAAGNQWVDFQTVVGTYSASVANATYADMIVLAKAIRDAMETAAGTTGAMAVGWGFQIKTGYNDTFRVNMNPALYTITLAQGNYTSPEAFAAEVQRALNAGGTGGAWTCSHVVANSTFLLGCSIPFAPAKDASGIMSPGWASLGVTAELGTGVFVNSMPTYVSRYKDHFWFQSLRGSVAVSIKLRWLSGSHASANCSANLGFLLADGSAVENQSAPYARGAREATALASQNQYGPKPDTALVADWIRDEQSALSLRDRLFDFGCAPRIWVRFRSHSCPDMQRMRVITFDNSLDARRPYPKFGSDGSWAGKTFRVTEVVQDLGPSYHTEVYAIEA